MVFIIQFFTFNVAFAENAMTRLVEKGMDKVIEDSGGDPSDEHARKAKDTAWDVIQNKPFNAERWEPESNQNNSTTNQPNRKSSARKKYNKKATSSLWHYVYREKECDPNKILNLLKKNANPNSILSEERGYTALHYAARNCTNKEVSVLLNWGADPNVVDKKGQTPLFHLMYNLSYHGNILFMRDHFGIVALNLMINAGANAKHIRNNGDNLLHAFLKSKYEYSETQRGPKIIQHLIKFTDMHHIDSEGNTALDNAIKYKPHLAKYILKAGGWSNNQSTWKNYPSDIELEYIIKLAEKNLPLPLNYKMGEMIEDLVENGKVDNFSQFTLSNFFQIATLYGLEETARKLLSQGANPDELIYDKESIFFLVLINKEGRNRRLKNITTLLRSGVNPLVFDEQGLTPLGYAIRHRMEKITNIFVKNKFNVINNDGNKYNPNLIVYVLASLIFLLSTALIFRKNIMELFKRYTAR